MLLAPVVRATPPFLPYRFRIYLACIIVYFDPGATNNGQHVRSWSLAFLLFLPSELTLVYTVWQHLSCPVKGEWGPRAWDLNRLSFSILLRNSTGAKTRYGIVSLVLKPNDPGNNWRTGISDIEITSIWIWNIKTYYLVSLARGLSGYWLLLNFTAILIKASWWLQAFFFCGRKCHTCVGSGSLLFYRTLLCHQRCSYLDRLEIQQVAPSFTTWTCGLWASNLHEANL